MLSYLSLYGNTLLYCNSLACTALSWYVYISFNLFLINSVLKTWIIEEMTWFILCIIGREVKIYFWHIYQECRMWVLLIINRKFTHSAGSLEHYFSFLDIIFFLIQNFLNYWSVDELGDWFFFSRNPLWTPSKSQDSQPGTVPGDQFLERNESNFLFWGVWTQFIVFLLLIILN